MPRSSGASSSAGSPRRPSWANPLFALTKMDEVHDTLGDAKLLEIGGGTLESHHKNMIRDLAEGLPPGV